MWISRQFTEKQEESLIRPGMSTLNSDGKVEAVSTGAERDVSIYSDYGYCYSLPSGTEMLISNCSGQQAAIGTLLSSKELKSGEIKITAGSGAYVYLKDNGSVIINGLEIDKNGVIASE